MAFENAKRLLQNKHARLSTTTEGIYDDNLIVLFWENIEAKHVTECINFLNESTQRVINAPSVFYDISFDSDLHHLHAYYREQDQRIYRVLAPNAITTSSITQSATKWRLLSGETYQAGTSNVVLVMYNVNPANIVALETEALSETFTDSIYLLGGTQLTGTWFNIARESDFQSDTGLYDLRWYISRYNTKEYIFHYKRNEEVTVVNFFKHHMTSGDISNFEDQYYFDKDSPGDYYVSTAGDPTNYISKNGDTTQTGSLSSISKPSKITDAQDGRTVEYTQKPDRENGEIDITVQLIYETSRSAGTSTPTENSISNPSTAFIQKYGEPERITKYIGSFKAISLPSSQDVSGTVATGGRSKSVKRVVNPEVQGNLYYYDLFEEIYTAPQDDGDAWMFTSSDLIFDRERKTVANYITSDEGLLNFEPADALDGLTSTTGPKYSTVEISTKRTKNVIKHRKYFVRHPLAADLTAAGITGLETASTSPTSVTQFRVVRLSKDLFAVERIVTTLGTKEVDNDNRTIASHARYKIQGGDMDIESQTDGLTGGT
jgi:hypothetical protein